MTMEFISSTVTMTNRSHFKHNVNLDYPKHFWGLISR